MNEHEKNRDVQLLLEDDSDRYGDNYYDDLNSDEWTQIDY